MERQDRGFAAPAWHSEQRTKASLVPASGEANLPHKFQNDDGQVAVWEMDGTTMTHVGIIGCADWLVV
jgi:hypothetical protein